MAQKEFDGERRSRDTEHCHTELLPTLSFSKLNEVQKTSDHSGVQSLGRFTQLIFREQAHRLPIDGDTLSLRDNDDLAIAAMFDFDHPNINEKVRDTFNDLGIITGDDKESSPLVRDYGVIYTAPEQGMPEGKFSRADLLPALNFKKLDEIDKASDHPGIHALDRFAHLVFEERKQRPAQPDDTICLRGNDDIAVAAMLGIEYPNVNDKVRSVFDKLGIIASDETEQQVVQEKTIQKVIPELLTYPAGENPHIPVKPLEGGTLRPIPATEVLKNITFDGLFPIAGDTTLELHFYENTKIDTRYARDRDRMTSLTRLGLLIEQEEDPSTKKVVEAVVPFFEASLIESEYLKSAFETPEIPLSELSAEQKQKFFLPFAISEPKDANKLNARLYGVPSDIRQLAFVDLGVTHEMLELLDNFNLVSISTSQQVVDYLHKHGFMGTDSHHRPDFLREHGAAIESVIAKQQEQEHEIKTGTDQEAAKDIINQISGRKRLPVDCVDGNAFGGYTNNGAIIDPEYLFDERYSTLSEEPMIDPRATWQTVLHMMGGTYTFGHDHTYLYRNRNEKIPNSYIGTPPDYGVIRPGNFLFHDLKYVESSSIRENFPLGYLLEYLSSHYLDRMDIHTPPTTSDGLPDNEDVHSYIYAKSEEGTFATPLQQIDTHIIPYRALKKDLASDEYFEYGEECYLAELVDIALQCDRIAEKAGHPESQFEGSIGEVSIGYYTNQMLEKVRLKGNGIAGFSTAVDQVLFMQGMQPRGGRESIVLYAEENGPVLNDLPLEQRYKDDNTPEGVKPPLTCYYEWFQRFARPVDTEEMEAKGVPIKPPLFKNTDLV